MKLGWEWGSPCKPKNLKFYLLLDIPPPKNWVPSSFPWSQIKLSLIAFRQMIPKFSSVACIFIYTIITHSKSCLELNPLIQMSNRIVTQNYTPVSPFWPKMHRPLVCFVAPLGVDIPPSNGKQSDPGHFSKSQGNFFL